MRCLIVNVGSSSVKLALYKLTECHLEIPEKPLWQGNRDCHSNDPQELVAALESLLKEYDLGHIYFVGHRVVHGGTLFPSPVIIDDHVEAEIEALGELAPLHTPGILEAIRFFRKKIPQPQVAVFDTSFYTTMPEKAKLYPGPYSWKEQKILRYGFHGINHQYCAVRCAHLLHKNVNRLKIVSCHIGNGVSVTAVDRGVAVDTTMGFTPLEGAMMGTRSGSIDAAIIPYLEKHGMSADEVLDVLNTQSGLLGISGISSDMRPLLILREQGDPRAVLAFEMYVHSLLKCVAAMIAVLEGTDVLCFTGGVGEHVPDVRNHIIASLAFCKKMETLVVKAEEDWSIACQSSNLLG